MNAVTITTTASPLVNKAHRAVAVALATTEPASVTRMRATTAAEVTPTLDQVERICVGLAAVEPLSVISDACGLTPDDVLTTVAQLGTWVRHVKPVPAKIELIKAKTLAVPATSQPPVVDGNVTVVIPTGFERAGSGNRRDVTKALAALVLGQPDRRDLARWAARQVRASHLWLDYSVVTTVYTFCRLGRADDLDQINPGFAPLTRHLVSAWDLLEQGRRDAIDAYGILAANLADPDPEVLARVAVLFETYTARVQRLIDAGATPALISKETGFLVQTIGTMLPCSVSALTLGQVRRLAAAAGLVVDTPSSAVESHAFDLLEEYGLSADADQLVHVAVGALTRGKEVELRQALDLRRASDPEWLAPLAATAA